MTNTEPLFTAFLNDVKPTQTLWALQDKSSEDWVVLDSSQFENTDVMPVWSSEELAKVHCVDEWQSYRPTKITVADWRKDTTGPMQVVSGAMGKEKVHFQAPDFQTVRAGE